MPGSVEEFESDWVHTAVHVVKSGETLQGLAIRYNTSVSVLKKRNKLLSANLFPGRELLVPATSPPPSRSSSECSQHEEDVYDSMPAFDYNSPSVHLLTTGFGNSGNKYAWVGSLFTATTESFVSRVTVRMRVRKGYDFAFRVVIADWPLLELGLPQDGHVQSPCKSPAPLHALYASEPMLLPPGGGEYGFHDVEVSMPAARSEEAVMVRRGQTLLLAVTTHHTERFCRQLTESQGRIGVDQGSEAQVACVGRVAAGPLLQGLLWSEAQPQADDDDVTLPTAGMGTDEEGRAMAVKVHFIPQDQSLDAAYRHSFGLKRQYSMSGSDLPLLLDREEELSPVKRRMRQEKIVGSYSDILPNGAYDAARLRDFLPERCRGLDWDLAYSARRHGLSMNTFFHKVKGKRDTVLLFRDDRGYVFGGYVPGPLKSHKDFYGTGESFVFQLYPTLTKYHWTGDNSMFIMTDMTGLVMGGGGRAAVWLDADFNNGGSGACSTFDSPCLASRELFTCIHLEVWCMFDDNSFGSGMLLPREELLAQMFKIHFNLKAYSKPAPASSYTHVDGSLQPSTAQGGGKKKWRAGLDAPPGEQASAGQDGGVTAVDDEALSRLLQMGFEHEACLCALRVTRNDVAQAAQWLLQRQEEGTGVGGQGGEGESDERVFNPASEDKVHVSEKRGESGHGGAAGVPDAVAERSTHAAGEGAGADGGGERRPALNEWLPGIMSSVTEFISTVAGDGEWDPRESVREQWEQVRAQGRSQGESDEELEPEGPMLDGSSRVLMEGHPLVWVVGMKVKLNLLQEHLHIAYRRSRWQKLYSSNVQGGSAATMLRMVKGRSPTVILVKDTQDHIFGAFVPFPLRSHPKHYGNDKCLLFSLHPSFRVHPASGQNPWYVLSNERGFALGGLINGNPHGAGFALDMDLAEGLAPEGCVTYGSTRCIASGAKFSCKVVEAWALLRPEEGTVGSGASMLGNFS